MDLDTGGGRVLDCKTFKKLRRLAGIPGSEIARAAGVNYARLSLWENSHADFRAEQVVALEQALNLAIWCRLHQLTKIAKDLMGSDGGGGDEHADSAAHA
jgi:transcriptional regulator with XRE-family HTH domain